MARPLGAVETVRPGKGPGRDALPRPNEDWGFPAIAFPRPNPLLCIAARLAGAVPKESPLPAFGAGFDRDLPTLIGPPGGCPLSGIGALGPPCGPGKALCNPSVQTKEPAT